MTEVKESKKLIAFHVTNEQREQIENSAKEVGRTVADYVRRKALGLD